MGWELRTDIIPEGGGGGSEVAPDHQLLYLNGTWIDPRRVGAASFSGSSFSGSQMFLIPIYLGRACTLDRIGVNVTTAGSAGSTMRLGLYEVPEVTSTSFTVNRLVDGGSVALDTTGAKEVTINVSVGQGFTFAAMWMSATASFTMLETRAVQAITSGTGLTSISPLLYFSGTNYASGLPASVSVTTSNFGGQGGGCPALSVRIAS